MSTTLRPALATGLSLITLAVGLALGLNPPADATRPSVPGTAGSTITDITGSAALGFAIHHLNGTVDHPETRSEAIAECQGYRALRKRVHCRTRIYTWYADLKSMKQTIRFYQRLFDRPAA